MEYKLEEILDVIQEINYEWMEFDQNSPIRLLPVTDGDFWGITWSNGFGDFIISSEEHPDWWDEKTQDYIPFGKVLREAVNAQINSFKGFKLQKIQKVMTPEQFAEFISSDRMTLLHWEEVVKLWASNPDHYEELTCEIADRLFPEEQGQYEE